MRTTGRAASRAARPRPGGRARPARPGRRWRGRDDPARPRRARTRAAPAPTSAPAPGRPRRAAAAATYSTAQRSSDQQAAPAGEPNAGPQRLACSRPRASATTSYIRQVASREPSASAIRPPARLTARASAMSSSTAVADRRVPAGPVVPGPGHAPGTGRRPRPATGAASVPSRAAAGRSARTTAAAAGPAARRPTGDQAGVRRRRRSNPASSADRGGDRVGRPARRRRRRRPAPSRRRRRARRAGGRRAACPASRAAAARRSSRRTRGSPAATARTTSAVPSVEPSSRTRISQAGHAALGEQRRAGTAPTRCASSRTGSSTATGYVHSGRCAGGPAQQRGVDDGVGGQRRPARATAEQPAHRRTGTDRATVEHQGDGQRDRDQRPCRAPPQQRRRGQAEEDRVGQHRRVVRPQVEREHRRVRGRVRRRAGRPRGEQRHHDQRDAEPAQVVADRHVGTPGSVGVGRASASSPAATICGSRNRSQAASATRRPTRDPAAAGRGVPAGRRRARPARPSRSRPAGSTSGTPSSRGPSAPA